MKKLFLTGIITLLFNGLTAQILEKGGGSVTGNIETTFQYYTQDSTIGAQVPPSKTGFNAFTNVIYSNGAFQAGVRLESYLPALLGYPQRFSGTGLGYRFAKFSQWGVEVTAGNFYEQFGSGMILRAYEQRALGIDNAFDGVNLRYRPYKGILIKGVWGKQRFDFDGRLINTEGTVRGIDGEVQFQDIFEKLRDKQIKVGLGGSFVSKFQADNNTSLILPQNVGSYGGRMNFGYKGFYLEGEYVHKENDPSFDNGYHYNNGYGLLFTTGYSMKGLGIVLQAKSIDNMSFRSDRNATLTDAMINFLPALTKTHTYNLAATLYPYATIPQGEVAFQADVIYTIPRKTKIGGKYGTTINVNYSMAYDINRNYIQNDSLLRNYTSSPFSMNADSLFFRDFNIQITRKFNKWFKMKLTYFNQSFNASANIVSEASGYINTHIAVVDLQFKLNRKNTIRTELQSLWTQKRKDQGDWVTGLIEYTISPHWFFAIMDQWNYGNPVKDNRKHYLLGSLGYIYNSMRFSVSYGRQRAGIFCVGGICRQVPASNGLTFSFTASF